jgi:hypothetical protein
VINRIYRVLQRDGISLFLVKAIAKILRVDMGIQVEKNKAWDILFGKYNYAVAYGPFKGMKLNKNVWWSKNDRITQTLGVYEEHVLKKMCLFADKGAKKLIDVGAADGYFAVGMAYSKIYSNVVAFEIETEGQNRILENATANKCEDKVLICGEADVDSIAKKITIEDKSTVLIDIEGGEYDLLSEKMLEILSDNYVICELHPWMVKDGHSRQKSLLDRASQVFNVELIKRDNYSPNMFPEFDDLSDEIRLIALGEGRAKNMQWLICTPK